MPGYDTNYAYAVGRIRVLETRLLDKAKLDRMIEAASAQDSLKVLAETDYSGAVAGLTNVHDFEVILRDEINDVYKLIRKISPQPHLTDILSLQFDVHNLKILFKAHYLGEDASSYLMPAGSIPGDKIQAMIKEGVFQDLPEELRAAAKSVSEEFSLSRNPQIIDIYLDRAYYETLINRAKAAGSEFLEGLFVRQIDLLNIKTFFRVKRMGRDKEFLQKALVPHGMIPDKIFLELLEDRAFLLAERLVRTEYANIINEGVREWQSEGTLTRFEKLADDHISTYLKKEKHNPFGLEPLIAYLIAKETEVKNIRMVMVGKINRLPVESIRERLRDVYV